MKIQFFQHCHNGDLFVSREFVKQVTAELPEFYFEYYHKNHPKTLLDLNISQQVLTNQFNSKDKFLEMPNALAINTWVGAYDQKINQTPPHYYSGGINLVMLYQIWGHIFEKINNIFQKNLCLKSVNDYIPEIDFQKYQITPVNKFLEECSQKKILFCNGEPRSKQSFREPVNDIIMELAVNLQNHVIICTEKFSTKIPNILFTDDIIQSSGSDLCEISYLSQYCDLVVGRNSGPFVFCLIKNNLLNPHKTFVSFNHLELDQFPLGADFSAKYVFSNNYQKQHILDLVTKTC
jgi:hypothetical protein